MNAMVYLPALRHLVIGSYRGAAANASSQTLAEFAALTQLRHLTLCFAEPVRYVSGITQQLRPCWLQPCFRPWYLKV